MTIWIGAALFCEGTTDHLFFDALIPRVIADLTQESPHHIEVNILDALPNRLRGRYTDFREEVSSYAAAMNLLFLHCDGGSDPDTARNRVLAPYVDAIAGLGGFESIPVVPVREMEAWALADPAAITAVTRSTVSTDDLPLPHRAGDVERITDPKQCLDQAVRICHAPRRGAVLKGYEFLGLLGERVSLERLSLVPSFQAFTRDLTDALGRLGCFGTARG